MSKKDCHIPQYILFGRIILKLHTNGNTVENFTLNILCSPFLCIIALKHDDVRDHNKPGTRCIAGELRGPAVEADGKQAVRNALVVVYELANIMPNTNCCVPLAVAIRNDTLQVH